MVIMHAIGVIKPEARERWFAPLDAVTPPSQGEDACQSYILYQAIETPKHIFVRPIPIWLELHQSCSVQVRPR